MKYCGQIGFDITVENVPGVWESEIVERTYRGDLKRVTSRWESSDKLNDDITLSNQISIIADPFAHENFAHMKYATYMGQKWKVVGVEIGDRPRLNLSLGGVYND